MFYAAVLEIVCHHTSFEQILNFTQLRTFTLPVVALDSEEFIFDGIQQWTQIVENRLPEPAGQLHDKRLLSTKIYNNIFRRSTNIDIGVSQM